METKLNSAEDREAKQGYGSTTWKSSPDEMAIGPANFPSAVQLKFSMVVL